MISLIAAMDRNRTIGKDNRLPWTLPADLAYFKKITMGHTVVMGRKTFESIGKPLPGRKNIIITKNAGYMPEGCTIYNTVDEVLRSIDKDEVFVIGGASIYSQFFPYADRLYITRIEYNFDGDTFFPEIASSDWKIVSETKGEKNEKNPYDYYFTVYERLKNS